MHPSIEDVMSQTDTMSPKERVFQVEGMHCGSCVSRIETGLKKALPELMEARVNLATGKATVVGDIDPENVVSALAQIGYSGRLLESVAAQRSASASKQDAPQQRVKRSSPLSKLVVATVLISPVFAMHMLGLHFAYSGWVQLALTTPVLFWCGLDIFKMAVQQAPRFQTDMNTLIALGAGVAWGYSLYLLLLGSPEALYFETAGMIVTLILLGRFLEAKAKGRAGEAIRALMNLQPETAWIQNAGDLQVRDLQEADWQEVPAASVKAGDRLLIRPGAQIPLDGEVVAGSSSVNESLITGESLPVFKQLGDAVIGGTLNESGSLTIQVTHAGDAGILARMVALVDKAQSGKPPIQKLADQVAGIFVPVVLGLALLTALGWLGLGYPWGVALKAAIAVLVIACPCALGLATPTAIQVGLGRAAASGILIRDTDGLDLAHRLNILVLDKTGTLTEGKPEVTRFKTVSNWELLRLLSWARAIEGHSEHPLAKAIVRAGMEMADSPAVNLEVTDFQSEPGGGVSGVCEGHRLVLGNSSFLIQQGILTATLSREAQEASQHGQTAVFYAVDQTLVGVFLIADRLKPDASKAIQDLRQLGISPRMLSGDRPETALWIGQQAGLTESEIEGGLSPADKQAFVQRLQASKTPSQKAPVVGMVGDGINDAPALAQADVSIAMGTGTDVAMSTAQITLLNGDVLKIVEAIALSRAILRVIRQNLFWAFFYNLIAIPAAALGFLSPMIAAGAMSLSSITVVLNALRLKRFQGQPSTG
jgi:Cu+-exporting ATPase